MTAESTPNHRRELRARTLLSGKIVYGARGEFTQDCLIRDLSDGGARLKLSEAAQVPDRFQLILISAGEAREARVAWRDHPQVGVAFGTKRDLKDASDPSTSQLRRLWLEMAGR
jgi:hypothetical protein